MNGKKALCPNSFLDDYSHKGYIIREEEHFYYVVNALTYEWSMYLNHKYLNDISPIEFIKPYHKPIENNFHDVTEGEEWIFDFIIESKEEFFLVTYFFEQYLSPTSRRKNNIYNAFNDALKKVKENMNPEYITAYIYNLEEYNTFSEKIYDFFISKFGISFIFEGKKPVS